MSFETRPDGCQAGNVEQTGQATVGYGPDSYAHLTLPSTCLPTIYLTNGSRRKRPGAGQYATDEWHVVLYLEPEIEAVTQTYETRERGAEGAIDVAGQFVDGDVDYREAYQVPRDAYFERLDEYVG